MISGVGDITILPPVANSVYFTEEQYQHQQAIKPIRTHGNHFPSFPGRRESSTQNGLPFSYSRSTLAPWSLPKVTQAGSSPEAHSVN